MKRLHLILILILVIIMSSACNRAKEQSPAGEDQITLTPTPSTAPAQSGDEKEESPEDKQEAPTPTVIGEEETGDQTAPEGDIFLPIAIEELLLGGYDGKGWVELEQTLSRVKQGETYQLFLDQEYVGTAIGKAPELDADFQTFHMVEMEGVGQEYNIAIGSEKELDYVKPRRAEKDYYETAVRSYFQEIGHPEYEIGYLMGYSYDFDQDGDEEDIIIAWQFQDYFYYEVPAEGCYSYVFYRDNGTMRVIKEARRGEVDEFTAGNLNIKPGDEIIINSRPEFMGAIDITGDGFYEIILLENGYESWGYLIFELQGGNYIKVLEEGAGV